MVENNTIDLIITEIESYNSSCEEGFDITIKDIINQFEKKK